MKIRVAIVDDHRILLEGLTALLERQSDIEIAGTADNGLDAVKLVSEQAPDILIMDISMPGLNGIDAMNQIKEKHPKTKVLILTMHSSEEYVYKAFTNGASGYVLKKSAHQYLLSAIRSVYNDGTFISPSVSHLFLEAFTHYPKSKPASRKEPQLTSREKEVLQLVAEGKTTTEIAEMLCISFKTASSHRQHIFKKLNVKNAIELTKYALKHNYISLDD